MTRLIRWGKWCNALHRTWPRRGNNIERQTGETDLLPLRLSLIAALTGLRFK
ncbi:hypothetical protein EVA_09492 [gut metagenome]|uniref:Uncharacterized protein n=1 Tax=gut metagenome TaxID=749906 RepID=J9GJZ2_9ZZZZ